MATLVNSDRVKVLREERGWTQEQLAELAATSTRTIQRLESAGTCSLQTRSALAAVFEVDAVQLGNPKPAEPSREPIEGSSAVRPIPMSPAALFAYLNGNPRPRQLVQRLADRRGWQIRPVQGAAYLDEQIAKAGIANVRDLDNLVQKHGDLSLELIDYVRLDGHVDAAFPVSYVVVIHLIELGGVEALIKHFDGLRYSGGGKRWAKDLFSYYMELVQCRK
jgi:transcriptional regulator with XRE-family HTH domain